MHKYLIIDAFNKAREELMARGNNDPSKTAISEELSEFISQENKVFLGGRSLRDYYDEADDSWEKEKDINISQQKVVIRLCNYLGCDTYQDYLKSLEADSTNKELSSKPSDSGLNLLDDEVTIPLSKSFVKRYKTTLTSVAVGGMLIIVFIIYQNQPRWMVWQNDHFIKATFDPKALQKGYLKMYNEDRILYFKKIKPDCQTVFFDQNSKPNLWYGKNNEGKLEYFTGYGLHPETGKTLKEITPYMIQKYLCPSFKR